MLCCRYVEVFEANPLDVEKAKDREEGGGGGGRGRRMDDGGHTVQLRGLPYKASEREIADWLSEAADPEDVIIIMDRLVESSSSSLLSSVSSSSGLDDPVDKQMQYSAVREMPGELSTSCTRGTWDQDTSNVFMRGISKFV